MPVLAVDRHVGIRSDHVDERLQFLLGGMAGNNSCGSRSIRYGNMVHNVRGIDALLADGSAFHFGASDQIAGAPPAYRELVARVHAVVRREAAEIEARWPKVLRRVQGYNIDMVQPGAEGQLRAHNLAHLLVGSEGTLAWFERLHSCFVKAFAGEVTKNRPFGGGYITRSHAAERPWVQLELSRAPFDSDEGKRARVLAALGAWCAAL